MFGKAAIVVVLALAGLTPAWADQPEPPADPTLFLEIRVAADPLAGPAATGLTPGERFSFENVLPEPQVEVGLPAAVPEPATAAFLFIGGAAILLTVRRGRRATPRGQ